MTDEQIERVAQAMHDSDQHEGLPWSCEYEGIKENKRKMARAALAAIPDAAAIQEAALREAQAVVGKLARETDSAGDRVRTYTTEVART